MRSREIAILSGVLLIFSAAGASPTWKPVGPFGGAAAFVQVDPANPGTVLAATANGLIFKSVNNGDLWTPVPFPQQLRGILHAFLIDPKQPGVIVAGFSSESSEKSGLYRSTDAGASWELLPGLKGQDVWSIGLWVGSVDVIAAGTREGVFLSKDGGSTWNRISPVENKELQPVVSLAFDPKDSNIIYAGTPHLPWKTSDGGASWVSIHNGMHDDSDVFSIQVDVTRPEQVYASACSGMYRSRDAGNLWSHLIGAQGASYRTYQIIQDPTNPSVVFAGTTRGLVKSTDGGVSWRALSHHATRSISFDPKQKGHMFVATDEAGIMRSEDGGETLVPVNFGFCNRILPSLYSIENAILTNTIFDSTLGGLFEIAGDSSDWHKIIDGSGLRGHHVFSLSAVPGNRNYLFAAGYQTLLASTDGGHSWKALDTPLIHARITSLLAVSKDEVLVGTESGLFNGLFGTPKQSAPVKPATTAKSASSGSRAKSAGSTAKSGTATSGTVKVKVVIGHASLLPKWQWTRLDVGTGQTSIESLLRLQTSEFAAVTGTGVYLSADGVTWNGGDLPHTADAYGVLDPTPGKLLAATSMGLMVSTDQGATWQSVPGALERDTVRALHRHPQNPKILFAAKNGVVYESEDAGMSWHPISPDNSPFRSIKDVAVIGGAPGRLYALTQNQGVFELPLPASGEAVASVSSQ